LPSGFALTLHRRPSKASKVFLAGRSTFAGTRGNERSQEIGMTTVPGFELAFAPEGAADGGSFWAVIPVRDPGPVFGL
jgi:hypothetical protein